MSAFQYTSANTLQLMLNTIFYTNPLVFYVFIAAIVLAVAITYFESLKVGLLTTAILSAFFYGIGMFLPYIYIPLALALVLFVLDILGFRNLSRDVENFINWVYLSRKMRGAKSRQQRKQDKIT
jgi:CHASE2 domain-containing sensor protein